MKNFTDKYAHLKEHETPVVKRGNSDVLFRAAPSEVIPVDVAENNVFKFIITTNNVDRYGDIVEPSGMDATTFLENPVFLFNHISSSDLMPIGKCLSLTPSENGVIGETIIHGKTELSKDALVMVQEGYLKAVSIGFMPTEWESLPSDPKSWCEPRKYTKWQLLEYSLVNIPANPYALITNSFISDVRKCMESGILAADSAMVKHVSNLLASGVSPELKKAIEQEMRGATIKLDLNFPKQSKLNLSFTKV
jgi:HK97 family phage prohead protease